MPRQRLNGKINRVRFIGVELEGGWDVAPKGESIESDGSVKFPSQSRITATFDGVSTTNPAPVSINVPGPKHKGEIISQPMTPEQIGPWVMNAYPPHVNETCGLHVHMSFFYRINYSRLMDPKFTPFMIERVRRWAEEENLPKDHPQWRRLIPNDPWTLQHCSHQYLGEAQAQVTHKDYNSRGKPYSRYTFVNYCYNMPGHNGPRATVEIRGLSMPPTAEMAVRGILAVVDATNTYLSKIREREQRVNVRVVPRRMADHVFRSLAA